MHRVLIIGSGGSGKSTLARRLAERTGLPLVHLDRLYWRAGWVPTPHADWDRVVAELICREAWIMDGNYGRTLPVRLAAADSVVFLDVSRWRCLWRVLKRHWLHAGRTRPELTPGCEERLDAEFLWWVWSYPARRRPGILAQLAALPATTRVHILQRPEEVEAFLQRCGPPR